MCLFLCNLYAYVPRVSPLSLLAVLSSFCFFLPFSVYHSLSAHLSVSPSPVVFLHLVLSVINCFILFKFYSQESLSHLVAR